MVQLNSQVSFSKIILALIRIKHHVLILNSSHFTKLKVLMTQMVFLDWLFIQTRKEETSIMFGNLKTKVSLTKLSLVLVYLVQVVMKKAMLNLEESILIKSLVELKDLPK